MSFLWLEPRSDGYIFLEKCFWEIKNLYICTRYRADDDRCGTNENKNFCWFKTSGNSSAVEHDLAKVGVAGSNPVFRSLKKTTPRWWNR